MITKITISAGICLEMEIEIQMRNCEGGSATPMAKEKK
jgi:hypothetical protein